jgi:hypothetical protein
LAVSVSSGVRWVSVADREASEYMLRAAAQKK